MILTVADASEVGEVRRTCADVCRKIGFLEKETGRVAIIATELATNIVKHARTGRISVTTIEHEGLSGIELCAMDSGPGHPNVERCLLDGYSTAGTAGTGLGAIKRLSDTFDIYSLEGSGTIVLSQVWPTHSAPKVRPGSPVFGAIFDPYPGEPVCGDAWYSVVQENRVGLVIADGLGHGILAHEAACEAVRIFNKTARSTPVAIIEAVHAGTRHTRGCAISVAMLDLSTATINFCGLGNVAGCMAGAGLPKRNMVSLNGTAGHNMRKAKDFSYEFTPGSMLVMHSDGIDTHWELSSLPQIERRHPTIIAAALFRDHRRSRDDATVVVMKLKGGDNAL